MFDEHVERSGGEILCGASLFQLGEVQKLVVPPPQSLSTNLLAEFVLIDHNQKDHAINNNLTKFTK